MSLPRPDREEHISRLREAVDPCLDIGKRFRLIAALKDAEATKAALATVPA